MNGGPGASSIMFGFFGELGPYFLDDTSLRNTTQKGVPDVCVPRTDQPPAHPRARVSVSLRIETRERHLCTLTVPGARFSWRCR